MSVFITWILTIGTVGGIIQYIDEEGNAHLDYDDDPIFFMKLSYGMGQEDE